ncbi:MOSC N-terminal beta barrel domain-containing protein [Streptomyces sp. NBC_01707]|uniref:hypothetical protein n=1 Tax=unclassified Streptomyces TaxID=2593676 RepID=UPI0029BCB29F|nr:MULTISPECIES: hypothetical protein [unclassified Streptomyces]MDX3767706.1 MOSC N-terminal beta barrel domain-containing protein [Streptomyces sp. AK08-01B]MDX3820588.1 MOSC N-terminal beta barrel domain-containing protein [Streptomyces sp. AK08-01A]
MTALYRHPVKSMRGQARVPVGVTRAGLSGDPTHAVLDETGAIGSAEHPRKWPGILRPPARRPPGRARSSRHRTSARRSTWFGSRP